MPKPRAGPRGLSQSSWFTLGVDTNPYAPPKTRFEAVEELGPDGKTCPRCGAHVSFWRVYFAIGPSFIRCRACRSRLGFDNLSGPGLVLTVLLVGVAGVSSLVAWRATLPAFVTWPLTFLLGAAVVTAPVLEWVRRHRRLRLLAEDLRYRG